MLFENFLYLEWSLGHSIQHLLQFDTEPLRRILWVWFSKQLCIHFLVIPSSLHLTSLLINLSWGMWQILCWNYIRCSSMWLSLSPSRIGERIFTREYNLIQVWESMCKSKFNWIKQFNQIQLFSSRYKVHTHFIFGKMEWKQWGWY